MFNLTVEPTTFSDPELGTITVDSEGYLTVTVGRSEVKDQTLARLRREVQSRRVELDARVEERAGKQQITRKAVPQPATTHTRGRTRGGFEDVTVLSRHSGHGNLYIQRHSGTKEYLRPFEVYRRLTDEEKAELEQLEQAPRTYRAVYMEAPQLADLVWDESVTARFDPERDLYVAEVDGVEHTTRQPPLLEDVVKRALAARTHPWAVNTRGRVVRVVPEPGVVEPGARFARTEEEAERLAEQFRLGEQADQRLRARREELRFDPASLYP